MAELQLKSKSWVVLLPNSHHHLPQSEVGALLDAIQCVQLLIISDFIFFCRATTESPSTTNITMSTTNASHSATVAPVLVKSTMSTY